MVVSETRSDMRAKLMKQFIKIASESSACLPAHCIIVTSPIVFHAVSGYSFCRCTCAVLES